MDPLAPEYPELTPYQFASNTPIYAIDLDGLEKKVITFWIDAQAEFGLPLIGVTTTVNSSHDLKAETYVQYRYVHNNFLISGPRLILEEEVYGGRGTLAPSSLFDYSSAEDKELRDYLDELYLEAGGDPDRIIERDQRAVDKRWDDVEDMSTLLGVATILSSRPNAVMKRLPTKKIKPKRCGCFVAGTLVKTQEGDRAIESIEVGDYVWAYSESTKDITLKQVIGLTKVSYDEIYELYISTGDTIRTTHEHPIYINGEFIATEEIEIGDTLYSLNGKEVVVNRINIVGESNFVYNFTVDDYHTYFVGNDGILVHNSKNPCDPYKLDITNDITGKKATRTVGELAKKMKKAKDAGLSPWEDIPVVELVEDNGSYLIRDGNHRVVAARIADVQVEYKIVDVSERELEGLRAGSANARVKVNTRNVIKKMNEE